MDTINLRNLRNVHLRKITLAILIWGCHSMAFSQLNFLDLGSKKLYFGISLGVNTSDFKIRPAPKQEANDSILTFQAKRGPGFNLGIIGNYQFKPNWDLRLIPTLVFADKTIEYQTVDQALVKKTISSIFLDFPLSLRFKSAPIKDFRVFVLAGVKYSFDLASNQTARKAEDQVRVRRHDFEIEYGIGFQFYFPFFILSPEVKVSHGILDIHEPSNLIFSRVLDSLFSRAFTISINLEG